MANKVRYNVTLPKKMDTILENISDQDDVSKGEVIRRALAIYDYLLKAKDADKKIVLRDDKANEETEIVFPDKMPS